MKRSSLSFFIWYFSLAYFSIVCALVFKRLSSFLVSLICWERCFSLFWRLESLDILPVITEISFGSKNIIHTRNNSDAIIYLFFSVWSKTCLFIVWVYNLQKLLQTSRDKEVKSFKIRYCMIFYQTTCYTSLQLFTKLNFAIRVNATVCKLFFDPY